MSTTTFQYELYQNLLSLAKRNESFYFIDNLIHEVTYRVFSYRMVSYTEFLQPGALECRGHTFVVHGDAFGGLVSLPMQKFFNLDENPFTQGLNIIKANSIMSKEDGSLISTVRAPGGDMLFKSKTAFFSSQSINAFLWAQESAPIFFEQLCRIVKEYDCTVNMEWTSPNNRIVVPHQDQKLTVLHIRRHTDGRYIPKQQIKDEFPAIAANWVQEHDIIGKYISHDEMVSDIRSMEGIEGFVLNINNQLVKLKTQWYNTLHKTKESVKSPKKILECIVNESVDDLKSMFVHDQLVLKRIKAIEDHVIPQFNEMISIIEKFYQHHKHKDRKHYALAAQAEMPRFLGLAMQLYSGREASYKEFMIKHSEEFLKNYSDADFLFISE